MQVPDWYDLNREWTVLIPRKMDGSGVVTLWMKAASAKHFGLDQFPRPECTRSSDPNGKCRRRLTMGKLAGANQGSFRLAYEWVPEKKRPKMVRFRLSSNYLIETLEVIATHLSSHYEGAWEIRNGDGNYLPTGGFRNFA